MVTPTRPPPPARPGPSALPQLEETGRSCSPGSDPDFVFSPAHPAAPAHRGAARTAPPLRPYGCHQGFGAVVPSALRRLPGRDHHQHDHVVQERTGFLRPHSQLQTRPDVSVSAPGRFCSAVVINT